MDDDALEVRRMKAVGMLRSGKHSQAEIARQLQVTPQSVSRWKATLEAAGKRGLRRATRRGRPPQVNTADLMRLERALRRGPEAYGYSTPLWTSKRVAALITELCGVCYHPSHVWRILQDQLGWSCQRPVGRALERDDQAITAWKRSRFPALKKSVRARGAPSSSSTRAD